MDELLTGADRDRIREFAVTQELTRPHLLGAGARLADQLRELVPSLADEQLAAVTACAAQVAGRYAAAAGCGHAQHVALLLQAVVVDLAHLELDR